MRFHGKCAARDLTAVPWRHLSTKKYHLPKVDELGRLRCGKMIIFQYEQVTEVPAFLFRDVRCASAMLFAIMSHLHQVLIRASTETMQANSVSLEEMLKQSRTGLLLCCTLWHLNAAWSYPLSLALWRHQRVLPCCSVMLGIGMTGPPPTCRYVMIACLMESQNQLCKLCNLCCL